MKIIVSHENADFDAVASMLAAHKLYRDAIPVLADRLNQNVHRFLALYQNGLPFVQDTSIRGEDVTEIIAVDTQRPSAVRNLNANIPMRIIDHHPLAISLEAWQSYEGDSVGAATTLLVEKLRDQQLPVNSLEATLMALGVYADTGFLCYASTTLRDINAAGWLLAQGAVLDTVRRFLSHPLNEDQQVAFELLLANAETRTLQGYTIIVAHAQVTNTIPELSSVAQRLRDTLDPAALFVIVQTPKVVNLICRSTVDAVDVGFIAREFGGGGHSRAAAASIHNNPHLENLSRQLWSLLETHVQPAVRVASLMSLGAQTLDVHRTVSEVAITMRRLGHEGFPVVDNGRVVGLITRRDVDRAVDHQLGTHHLHEIMIAGEVTLHPEDSVMLLEQRMVESGWGQIPVVDPLGQVIGIVTRTDLIKHWAKTHPDHAQEQPHISTDDIISVLGTGVARLIQSVTDHAQNAGHTLFMVGGVVRDLLLKRANLDIDFVVEDSAITFAHALQQRFGGEVSSFQPFGTAKWYITAEVREHLTLPEDTVLPEHVDFATARNEFYEHPTALPTVYSSSIKLDLQRRDFTINTLAIQLSPAAPAGRLIDNYGGLHDLNKGIIRVLHSLSFVDDPTRILRAVRFEQRLHFQIDSRTAQLIDGALPMLRRITGQRIRHEIDLLLQEDQPEHAFERLSGLGVLDAFHAGLHFTDQTAHWFRQARQQLHWPGSTPDLTQVYWHLLILNMSLDQIKSLSERLMLSKEFSQSLQDMAVLHERTRLLTAPDVQPSQIVEALEPLSKTALIVFWLISAPPLHIHIQSYLETWQHIYQKATGHTLKLMNIPPGPRYQKILRRLRAAWLDGEVHTAAEEYALLEQFAQSEEFE